MGLLSDTIESILTDALGDAIEITPEIEAIIYRFSREIAGSVAEARPEDL